MRQPELHRVLLGGLGQLVHEAFDAEHVRISPQPTLGRDAQRLIGQEMRDHLRIREHIERNAVAIPAALGLRNRLRRWWGEGGRDVPGGQQIAAGAGAVGVGVAPHAILPIDNPPVGIQRRLDLGDHGGRIGLPGVFLLAHPLHADRHAGHGAGEEGGVGGGVIGSVMAITASTFDMDQPHLGRRHRHQLGNRRAIREHALGVAPDRHLVALQKPDGARRADGAVHLVGTAILHAQPFGICRDRGGAVEDGGVFRRQGPDDVEDLRLLRQGTTCGPCGGFLQRSHCLDCLPFMACNHREERAIANHFDYTRHGAGGVEIDGDQARPIPRWADHPGMQHAGQAHILNEGSPARHLGGNIHARQEFAADAVMGRVFHLGRACGF